MTHAHKATRSRSSAIPIRVRVHFNGRVVADTRAALTLREASLAPVIYIPRADADMTLLERTSHHLTVPSRAMPITTRSRLTDTGECGVDL